MTPSDRIIHYARKGHELVSRIDGPVSRMALHYLKGLHLALGYKIKELECQHLEKATTPQTERAFLEPLPSLDGSRIPAP